MLIENWSVVPSYPVDPYTAPELIRHFSLNGNLEGGKNVTTSTIQSVFGRKVYTKNSVYTLGQPSEEYKKWVESNFSPDWDWENAPIKM